MNWFEGGRRIRDLLLWVIGLAGAVYVLWGDTPAVYFETSYPDDPWRFTTQECRYPDNSESVGKYAFKVGDSRNVNLCFRADERDLIAYREAPQPDYVLTDTAGPGAEETKWYFHGTPFSQEVTSYIDRRTREFVVTPFLAEQAKDGLRRLSLLAAGRRLEEAFLWIGGLMAFIWIATAALGWIARGFAGIPHGADFRTPKKPDSNI